MTVAAVLGLTYLILTSGAGQPPKIGIAAAPPPVVAGTAALSQADAAQWIGAVGGYASAVAAADGRVYAAIGARVHVYDGGAEPAPLGQSAPLAGRILGLAASGGIVSAAVGSAGLWIIDARDPPCGPSSPDG